VENKIRKLTPQHSFFLTALAIPSVSMLLGCGPSIEDLEAVDYTPVKRNEGVRLILRSQLWKMTVNEKRPEILPAIA
jgi:hypothetical protein